MGNLVFDVEDSHSIRPLNRAALLGIMFQLSTSKADHPRPIVGVLASTCVVGIVVPGRPLVRFLGVEVLSLIPHPLDFALFIEVVVPFLHCPLYIHRSVIQVYVRRVLMH